MRRLLLFLPFAVVAGCQSLAPTGTPLVSCADPGLALGSARLGAEVDAPPEPVGGLRAVQERVRVPNEGGPLRPADPAERYAVVRALVDTTGAVRCSDAVEAATVAKGDAARRAVHASAFTPGRHRGQPTAVLVDLTLDVRGQGVRRVVRGDQF